MDKNQKASLGCGTLILIALIVLIFANIGGNKCAEEVRNLHAKTRRNSIHPDTTNTGS